MSRLSATAALVAWATVFAGCTVKKTEVPALSGPSELGLSLQTRVFPDILEWDGISQSSIEIIARGPDSRPVASVPIRVETHINGQPIDFGQLSTKNVVTGADGAARLAYTAPPKPAEAVDTFTVVTVWLVPIGNDYNGSQGRSVEIRLKPTGRVLPPNNVPVPSFVVTPTPATTVTPVTLDASGTTDEGQPCGNDCLYSWDFGDGSAATGQVVGHEFRVAGSYTVRLTVTDIRGQSATTAQAVVVTQTPRPVAAFTYSPAAPRFGQAVFFNASSSQAAAGHRLVAFDWDFGTGRTGSGMTISKTFDIDLIPPGAVTGEDITFNVTLIVHDDTFQPTGQGVLTSPVKIKVP